MLLTAFGAAVAAQMLAPIADWLARERRGNDLNSAYTLGDAAAAWALTVLAADRLRGDADHAREPWATRLPATAIEGGVLEGYLTDLQGRFNLNSLAPRGQSSAVAIAAGRRVFAALGVRPDLADLIADAIDTDDLSASGQSERQAWGAVLPNRALEDLSALRQLPGVSAADIARLAGRVTVLPDATAVNVNTAEPWLLQALLTDIDATALARLLAERETRPVSSVAELRARLGAALPEGLLGVGSEYFALEARVRYGSVDHRLQLKIHRPPTARPSILSRLTTHG